MAGSAAAKNKRQEEKYVQMIRELGALPTNKQCFDCNSKGPTYVEYDTSRRHQFASQRAHFLFSVTVGTFVCTACSGLL